MLGHLTYSVTFPSTGRTLKGDVDFKNGFGVITGANEAGKSFIIEVVRWCLFGSAALRGKAEDYKNLKAELYFRVKSYQYSVSRTANAATLYVHDEQCMTLATGTKPVNAHILKLLGFGLDVFDVACSANQGDIEKLGTMKPTERKRMVDEVIGLTKIDEVARWCGEEAKVLERHVAPGAEPLPPDTRILGFDAVAVDVVLPLHLAKVRQNYEELMQLKGKLQATRKSPFLPHCSIEQTVDELRPLAHQERELQAELSMLKKQLAALPQPSPFTDEELNKIEKLLDQHLMWTLRQKFEKLHPQSNYHRQQLNVMLDDWTVVEQRESLTRLVRELEGHGEVDCPNCQHHFYLENDRVEDLRSKLQALQDIQKPELTRARITVELAKLDDWVLKETRDLWEKYKDVQAPTEPIDDRNFPMRQQNVQQYRKANAAAADRTQIELRIQELGQPSTGYQQLLEQKIRHEEIKKAWERDCDEYAIFIREQCEAKVRAQQLSEAEELMPALLKLDNEWRGYKVAHEHWVKTKQAYDDAQAEALGWRAAQQALNDLRVMVKGHLVPALSRVASALIAQMTGGQRSQIVVDEDFDVTVDGQALGTLSGSGKAVANLALRLGLGQVLTNGVFSIFIGDEIDASMDNNRAENMTNSVRGLVQRISQIIIITHKYPVDADWHINLGNGEWTN